MKVPQRSILMSASWVAALGIGLMIGRQTIDQSSPASADAPSAGPETSLSSLGRGGNSANPTASTSRKVTASAFTGTAEEKQHQAMVRLSDILNTSNRIERTRQLLAFIDQLGPDGIEGVIDGFREAGWVDYNRSEYSMLISAWMNNDPLTAITYLDENEPDGWTRKTAIAAWAAENPEAAANAIDGLEDGGRINDWVVGLVQGMARNDPQSALDTLLSMSDGATRRQAIRGMLPEVVSRGTEFAGEWIEQIEEPKLQSETARRLGGALARRDPESASEWIKGMKTVGSRRDASEVVSEIYASRDLEAARAWAESLPKDTMTEAAEGVATHMARKDPAEAAAWLQKLGDDPDLDGARMNFLREASRRDPQAALENVSTLSQPRQQERQYHDILRTWRRNDSDAAINWAIANSESIPPRVLNSIVPKDRRPN